MPNMSIGAYMSAKSAQPSLLAEWQMPAGNCRRQIGSVLPSTLYGLQGCRQYPNILRHMSTTAAISYLALMIPMKAATIASTLRHHSVDQWMTVAGSGTGTSRESLGEVRQFDGDGGANYGTANQSQSRIPLLSALLSRYMTNFAK